jgi:histidine kinase
MMLNSRDDINQIINNIAKQPEIENIRIFNKEGRIQFTNREAEIDHITNIKAEACDICHKTDPPIVKLSRAERTRIFKSPEGHQLLGIIAPIYNEPGCATDACHVHPEDKQILGALDVVISLAATDREILLAERGVIGLAAFVFLFTSTIIFVFVLEFVNRPIQKLIDGTRSIARGDYFNSVEIARSDEMGQLAEAINKMGQEIGEKQAELNRQRDEYQDLFERVPCIISLQDKNYRLVKYNREFSEKFDPQPGDYCYQAYKGLNEKCPNCPVEKTFQDGASHYSEETGRNKDGTFSHWIVRTSPIKNTDGEIVAAMEMSLDITPRKQLEEKLEESEQKYHAIFNNIPNPVFVLDRKTLEIRDCNESITSVYGYTKEEVIHKPFSELFRDDENGAAAKRLKTASVINQAKHIDKKGNDIYVDIWISPSEYSGEKVFLVTTSDITQRLEAEQQLIQAGKMATLGEMATGVAHELNQPLSVIKTASSFFVKKINREEEIVKETLHKMLNKIDTNVDRASKIINHMRQFARKSDMDLEKVHVNEILERAFEIFSQQLKVRGIDVVWNVQDNLPKIMADPSRLEQVFINLLINARDAIEEKWASHAGETEDDSITIMTRLRHNHVIVEVRDTGIGISDAIVEKLFNPFFTTKEVGKGTGLGLSISYGIVKECGGDIEAGSVNGEGAVFTLTFPVSGDAPAANRGI